MVDNKENFLIAIAYVQVKQLWQRGLLKCLLTIVDWPECQLGKWAPDGVGLQWRGKLGYGEISWWTPKGWFIILKITEKVKTKRKLSRCWKNFK